MSLTYVKIKNKIKSKALTLGTNVKSDHFWPSDNTFVPPFLNIIVYHCCFLRFDQQNCQFNHVELLRSEQHGCSLVSNKIKKITLSAFATLWRGSVAVLFGTEGRGRLSCSQRAVLTRQLDAAVVSRQSFSQRRVSVYRCLKMEQEQNYNWR